jgi:hypothetical protein
MTSAAPLISTVTCLQNKTFIGSNFSTGVLSVYQGEREWMHGCSYEGGGGGEEWCGRPGQQTGWQNKYLKCKQFQHTKSFKLLSRI